MRVALTTSASFPAALRSKALKFLARRREQEEKVVLAPSRRHLAPHSCSLLSESRRRWLSIGCSIKAQAAENFGEPNEDTSKLNSLADRLWDRSPEPLKEFPWKKARSMVVERLLFLGQKALKWSLIALFTISCISDVSLAVSRNRELLIPLGLFIGVTLADFLKESSQEFFASSIKDGATVRHLLGIGSFFVLVKFLSLCFKEQGRVLLSHIGNGGLMQVLWLAKELQQTMNVDSHEEQIPDAPISCSWED